MPQKIASAASTLAPGRIYALEEAATILGCDIDAILDYGGQGAISLLTHVPDDVVVCSTNKDVLKYHDPACDPAWKFSSHDRVSGMEPIALSRVLYLRLSALDCATVRNQGICRQAVYSSALHSNAEQELAVMELPALTSNMVGLNHVSPLRNILESKLGYTSKCVACYAADTAYKLYPAALKNIQLTGSVLYILGKDINKLLANHDVPRKASSLGIPFDDGFVEQDYMSKRLIVLHRAALAFFNPNHKPPAEPTNKNIVVWIEQEYLKETGAKFGQKLADNAIKLIRGPYARWDQKLADERRAKDDLTQFDTVVAVGEAWGGKVDRTRRDVLSPGLKDELINVFGFQEDLANCAVTLLRPEGVPFLGRLPKK